MSLIITFMFENELGAKFKDRQHAGLLLAEALAEFRSVQPIVLGVPTGGAVVGFHVAKRLEAQFGAYVARTVADPKDGAFPVAGIAQGGLMVLSQHQAATHRVTEPELKRAVAREADRMAEQVTLYSMHRHNPVVEGRVIILVDEGVMSSLAIQAAIASLLLQKAGKIVLAVPVLPKDFADLLEGQVDVTVALRSPVLGDTLDDWYEELPPVTDSQVIALLHKARETYPRQPDVH